MKYKVHIYAVIRLPLEVEAESQEEAINKTDEFDLHHMIDNERFEYAEDIDCFLVDEVGAADYTNSQWFDKHGIRY